jgi:hypothetical protein
MITSQATAVKIPSPSRSSDALAARIQAEASHTTENRGRTRASGTYRRRR